MMKTVLVILLSLVCVSMTNTEGRQTIALQTEFLQPSHYTIDWYAGNDTTLSLIGKIQTEVCYQNDQVIISQKVLLNGDTRTWIDSTIVLPADLSPVYHSSRNAQRSMFINYNATHARVNYSPVQSDRSTTTEDSLMSYCFDSNFVPFLIPVLPLESGFTCELPVYTYASEARHGVNTLSVISTTIAPFVLKDRQCIDTYCVTVVDNATGLTTVYSIGIDDRLTYSITILSGTTTMKMILDPSSYISPK